MTVLVKHGWCTRGEHQAKRLCGLVGHTCSQADSFTVRVGSVHAALMEGSVGFITSAVASADVAEDGVCIDATTAGSVVVTFTVLFPTTATTARDANACRGQLRRD